MLCFRPDFLRYKKYNIRTGIINTYPLIERIRISEIGNIFFTPLHELITYICQSVSSIKITAKIKNYPTKNRKFFLKFYLPHIYIITIVLYLLQQKIIVLEN